MTTATATAKAKAPKQAPKASSGKRAKATYDAFADAVYAMRRIASEIRSPAQNSALGDYTALDAERTIQRIEALLPELGASIARVNKLANELASIVDADPGVCVHDDAGQQIPGPKLRNIAKGSGLARERKEADQTLSATIRARKG